MSQPSLDKILSARGIGGQNYVVPQRLSKSTGRLGVYLLFKHSFIRVVRFRYASVPFLEYLVEPFND